MLILTKLKLCSIQSRSHLWTLWRRHSSVIQTVCSHSLCIFNPHFYSRLTSCSEISMATVGWQTFPHVCIRLCKEAFGPGKFKWKSACLLSEVIHHVIHAQVTPKTKIMSTGSVTPRVPFLRDLSFIRNVNVCSVSMWYEARDSVWTQAVVGMIKFNSTQKNERCSKHFIAFLLVCFVQNNTKFCHNSHKFSFEWTAVSHMVQ